MKDPRYDVQCLRKKTVAKQELTFTFNVKGREYLVKNLTDSDIYVDFKSGRGTSGLFLIPENCAQVLSINGGYNTVYVYPMANSDKGVEIQCLNW